MRRSTRVFLLAIVLVLIVSVGAAYHDGQGQDTTVEGDLTGQEALQYLLVPFIIVAALTYSLVQPFLVKRYTGDSQLKPDPEDMRKYAAIAAVTVGAIGVFIGIAAGIAHAGTIIYAGFILAGLLLTAVLNQGYIRDIVSDL